MGDAVDTAICVVVCTAVGAAVGFAVGEAVRAVMGPGVAKQAVVLEEPVM